MIPLTWSRRLDWPRSRKLRKGLQSHSGRGVGLGSLSLVSSRCPAACARSDACRSPKAQRLCRSRLTGRLMARSRTRTRVWHGQGCAPDCTTTQSSTQWRRSATTEAVLMSSCFLPRHGGGRESQRLRTTSQRPFLNRPRTVSQPTCWSQSTGAPFRGTHGCRLSGRDRPTRSTALRTSYLRGATSRRSWMTLGAGTNGLLRARPTANGPWSQ